MFTDTDKAFPFQIFINDERSSAACMGMDLRDYFAAKALPALIRATLTEPGKVGSPINLSESSYQIADAMMKARDAS